MDSSAPTILPPGSESQAHLLSFIVFVLYLSCEKNENKQKEAGFGPFLKTTKISRDLMPYLTIINYSTAAKN